MSSPSVASPALSPLRYSACAKLRVIPYLIKAGLVDTLTGRTSNDSDMALTASIFIKTGKVKGFSWIDLFSHRMDLKRAIANVLSTREGLHGLIVVVITNLEVHRIAAISGRRDEVTITAFEYNKRWYDFFTPFVVK